MSVIDFPPRPGSVADHADAWNAIRDLLKKFKPEERVVILSGRLGSELCATGRSPSRYLAIAGLGVAFEAALDMIDRVYGERDGVMN